MPTKKERGINNQLQREKEIHVTMPVHNEFLINKPHFRGIWVGLCFVHACRAREFGPFTGVIELLIHAKENHHP